MLETVREFALERLAASGEEVVARQAHAAYFLGLAERAKPLLSAGLGAWLSRLEADLPNFRVALESLTASDDHDAYLRLAANLEEFWWMRGHLAEGRRHLERALSRAPAPTPHRAEALTRIGRIVTSQGDIAAGETWLRQGVALARSLSVPALLSWALFELGQAVEYAGDLARAVPLYESALAVARDLNNAHATGVALWALSEAAYGRGDLEAAGRLNEETVAVLRSAGNEFLLSLSILTNGEVALGLGDLPRAVVAYQEALDLALGIDMQWAIAGALAGFAAVPAARGHHVAAAELLGAAATIREASHQDRFPNFYHHAQTTQTVRAALGEEAFVAAWEAGRAMPAEEAVDLPRSLGLLEKSDPSVPSASLRMR
jgi:tetratricopeptide (TPR) repeat protein